MSLFFSFGVEGVIIERKGENRASTLIYILHILSGPLEQSLSAHWPPPYKPILYLCFSIPLFPNSLIPLFHLVCALFMGLREDIAVQKATLKSPQCSMYEWSNESTSFKTKAAKTAKYEPNGMFSGPP